MNTLQLAPLPELRLTGRTEDVTDESEIPEAVERLLVGLGVHDDHGGTLVVSYDGNTNPEIITVSAGLVVDDEPRDAGDPDDLTSIVLLGAETSASVTYPSRPTSFGDAWIALDTELEKYQLRTTGPYRQTTHPDGTITLAAPTRTFGA